MLSKCSLALITLVGVAFLTCVMKSLRESFGILYDFDSHNVHSYGYGAYVLLKALDTKPGKLSGPASDTFQLHSVLALIKTMYKE